MVNMYSVRTVDQETYIGLKIVTGAENVVDPSVYSLEPGLNP